jgi:hypothetical protein
MASTRRVAERLIVERAARCRLIAQQLRDTADRLDSYVARDDRASALENEAKALRNLASQVERL